MELRGSESETKFLLSLHLVASKRNRRSKAILHTRKPPERAWQSSLRGAWETGPASCRGVASGLGPVCARCLGPSFRHPAFPGVGSPPLLSSVVPRVSVRSFPLRLQPICNCFSLIFLKITCSCLAREWTAVSVRFIRIPIALELRPVGANFRSLSSSACVHGREAKCAGSVISPRAPRVKANHRAFEVALMEAWLALPIERRVTLSRPIGRMVR
jgi:hypothetical protein